MSLIKKHVRNLKRIVDNEKCVWRDFKFSSNGHIHIVVSDPEGREHRFSTGETPKCYDRAAKMFRADLRAAMRGSRKSNQVA